ncbi:hypothetical protein OLMES_5068 [Oleiphilus messinensis]|uniref:Uncharacterized protein n=1 Tax=Oleiphilus messinensis TaxID=141451 RepID=A0A1Y0IEU9_9GAMM|nr:hypothetical protein [Oleiphilus messinensis]ARU59052.1 hypothetical protein OLMES_5068 [Oleiphilus messinensis]
MALSFFRKLFASDPAVKACVDDVIQSIRNNPDVKPDELATVYQRHGRTQADIGAVTKCIRPRLVHTGIGEDEWDQIMITVRQAKLYLE